MVRGAEHKLDMECQRRSLDFLNLFSEGHVQIVFGDGLALLACPLDPKISVPIERASQVSEQLSVPLRIHVLLSFVRARLREALKAHDNLHD